jgi:hypothetical protein
MTDGPRRPSPPGPFDREQAFHDLHRPPPIAQHLVGAHPRVGGQRLGPHRDPLRHRCAWLGPGRSAQSGIRPAGPGHVRAKAREARDQVDVTGPPVADVREELRRMKIAARVGDTVEEAGAPEANFARSRFRKRLRGGERCGACPWRRAAGGCPDVLDVSPPVARGSVLAPVEPPRSRSHQLRYMTFAQPLASLPCTSMSGP